LIVKSFLFFSFLFKYISNVSYTLKYGIKFFTSSKTIIWMHLSSIMMDSFPSFLSFLFFLSFFSFRSGGVGGGGGGGGSLAFLLSSASFVAASISLAFFFSIFSWSKCLKYTASEIVSSISL
jgi:hypothetical protein